MTVLPSASGARRSVVARSVRKLLRSRLLIPISGAPMDKGAVHFRFVMHLDQYIHREPRRLGDDRLRGIVVEDGEDDQHGVCTVETRLGNLARIDDEILGKDRAVEGGAGGAQIGIGAAKMRIDEHTHRVCDPGIGAGDGGRFGIAAQFAFRWRGAFELENETSARTVERGLQAARRRLGLRPQLLDRRDAKPGRKFRMLGVNDRSEHSKISHDWPRHIDRAPPMPCPSGAPRGPGRRHREGRWRGWRQVTKRRC